MTPPLSVLTLGFLLGLRHATDADHVVAVTAIVSRERRPRASSMIGALWGMGHSLTILVVGGAIIVFNLVIPARLGLGMELAVAAILIALGVATLSGWIVHPNGVHPDIAGSVARGPTGFIPVATRWGLTKRVAARPVALGIVHGLAGSAGATLLVLSTVHHTRWALVYLLMFGLGTLAGMMLVTTAIALPFISTSRRFDRVNVWLVAVTGLASVLFGVFIAYTVIVVQGLFSAAPRWTPE